MPTHTIKVLFTQYALWLSYMQYSYVYSSSLGQLEEGLSPSELESPSPSSSQSNMDELLFM